MRLRVFEPTRVRFDQHVDRVSVEAEGGSFTMLPRHVDAAAVLAPGILGYVTSEGVEGFLAVNGGTVVKVGDDVLVSTPEAVAAAGLPELRRAVEESFLELEEREEAAIGALARLEADVIQRMVELEEHGR